VHTPDGFIEIIIDFFVFSMVSIIRQLADRFVFFVLLPIQRYYRVYVLSGIHELALLGSCCLHDMRKEFHLSKYGIKKQELKN